MGNSTIYDAVPAHREKAAQNMAWEIVALVLGVATVIGLTCIGILYVILTPQRITARTAVELLEEEAAQPQWPDVEL